MDACLSRLAPQGSQRAPQGDVDGSPFRGDDGAAIPDVHRCNRVMYA